MGSISLGSKVRDTITGFEGVVTARMEQWHTLPTRLCIASKGLYEGKPIEEQWIDEERCELLEA